MAPRKTGAREGTDEMGPRKTSAEGGKRILKRMVRKRSSDDLSTAMEINQEKRNQKRQIR
jgi:hypothetical protein